ncbi:MAG: hypothetical protein EAX81_00615 [Candidatus Thorarchaeota archaeon]|nr:hypothetical protein [Candidatus Thorarchaeota archaeon]
MAFVEDWQASLKLTLQPCFVAKCRSHEISSDKAGSDLYFTDENSHDRNSYGQCSVILNSAHKYVSAW